MATQEEIDRARTAQEIAERYTRELKVLDLAYRREMQDLFGEPQPGLISLDVFWVY